jgi:hypothetical protein
VFILPVLAWLIILEKYFEKRLERARRFVWSLTVPLAQARVVTDNSFKKNRMTCFLI